MSCLKCKLGEPGTELRLLDSETVGRCEDQEHKVCAAVRVWAAVGELVVGFVHTLVHAAWVLVEGSLWRAKAAW